MNKNVRQLFITVIVLFTLLGISSSIITTLAAPPLNANPLNKRSFYLKFAHPRGAILASDGRTIAQSQKVNDPFGYQRSYPQGALYAPVTGFFSITQGNDRGIESSRDKLLSGTSHALFFNQVHSLLTGTQQAGASIETSIVPRLQKVAYQQLQGKEGAVVAIEPSTGRILAMVSTPSYDPNLLAQHDSKKANAAYQKYIGAPGNPVLNKTISQVYPPGSTFKVVVAAAALETGQYQPDSIIPAGADYVLPGTSYKLTNAERAANGSNGKISFEDALAYSSNTAFAQLGVKLGTDAVATEARKFGFDDSIVVDGTRATGSQMNAVPSLFRANSPDRLALGSIGQGDVTVTPLQDALVAAAVANRGQLMQPTLVDRVRANDLSVISQTQPRVMSVPFSENTANKLKQMMEAVVRKNGAGIRIPGISVAAKTGTAQIGDRGEKNDGWVIGFAPANQPKIAVAVVVHNVNLYGAESAGPIMRRVIEEALKP